jgi:hypothetical protein
MISKRQRSTRHEVAVLLGYLRQETPSLSKENTKFGFTDETLEVDGRTLYRIVALKDFSNIRKGEIGGFIENEDNLDFNSNAWIADTAQAYQHSRVSGSARLSGNTKLSGNIVLSGNAELSGEVRLSGYMGHNFRTTEQVNAYVAEKVKEDEKIAKRIREISALRSKLFRP